MGKENVERRKEDEFCTGIIEKGGIIYNCEYWIGDEGWDWRRTNDYEEHGDSESVRNYLMKAYCPRCGEKREVFYKFDVLERIRVRKKQDKIDGVIAEQAARIGIDDLVRRNNVRSESVCVLCANEIPRKRRGWTTCSEKCAVVMKRKVKKNKDKEFVIVKDSGKWEVWLWEYEDWELIDGGCKSREEAVEVSKYS